MERLQKEKTNKDNSAEKFRQLLFFESTEKKETRKTLQIIFPIIKAKFAHSYYRTETIAEVNQDFEFF